MGDREQDAVSVCVTVFCVSVGASLCLSLCRCLALCLRLCLCLSLSLLCVVSCPEVRTGTGGGLERMV